MPNDRLLYTAMKTSSAFLKGLGNTMVNLIPTKETKETAAVLEELAKAGPSIRMDSYSLPLSGLQVYRYDDPAKAVDAQLKMFKTLYSGDGKANGLKEKPVVKTKAEKYGNMELHSVPWRTTLSRLASRSGIFFSDDTVPGTLGPRPRSNPVSQCNVDHWLRGHDHRYSAGL